MLSLKAARLQLLFIIVSGVSGFCVHSPLYFHWLLLAQRQRTRWSLRTVRLCFYLYTSVALLAVCCLINIIVCNFCGFRCMSHVAVIWCINCSFLTHDAMRSAAHAMPWRGVCPSECLLHSSIVWKQRNTHPQVHLTSASPTVLLYEILWRNSNGVRLHGASNEIHDFRPISSCVAWFWSRVCPPNCPLHFKPDPSKLASKSTVATTT